MDLNTVDKSATISGVAGSRLAAQVRSNSARLHLLGCLRAKLIRPLKALSFAHRPNEVEARLKRDKLHSWIEPVGLDPDRDRFVDWLACAHLGEPGAVKFKMANR